MAIRPLIILFCGFLWLTLLGMHAVPALLPTFVAVWSLSNTEAGWLAGISYLTYMLGVAFVGVTDRIDARRLLILGALINAVGYGGMGLVDDYLGALFFRALQGLGFAWTYLPGVKAISDRIAGPDKGRATSIYVSSFAIGSSFSVLIAAEIGAAFGWQWAFGLPALSNLAAAALIWRLLPPVRLAFAARPRRLLPNFRPVLRNRPALGFIIGSFAHNFELIAVRSWTVAFLTWAVVARPDLAGGLPVPLVATLLILIGVPTSIAGGEAGHRIGHARAVFLTMTASALAALLVGFSAAWPIWAFAGLILTHNLLLLADSGTLNAGAINAAEPAERGNTVAAFGVAAAAGGLAGPVLFGVILDHTGGGGEPQSWGWAFASLGLIMLVGAAAVRALSWSRYGSDEPPARP